MSIMTMPSNRLKKALLNLAMKIYKKDEVPNPEQALCLQAVSMELVGNRFLLWLELLFNS